MAKSESERLSDLQQNWNALGALDPMWAILTDDPAKFGHQWDQREFFETGKADIDDMMAEVDRLGPGARRGKALDFGCGIGRLTQGLARYFDSVVGIDIARSMIEEANRINPAPDRCSYVLNERSDLSLFPDGAFDFVYSAQVLQHMPPELADRYISEFLRVVAPAGFVVFQLPEPLPKEPRARLAHLVMPLVLRIVPAGLLQIYRRRKYRNASSQMIRALPKSVMEMHGARPGHVRRLVERRGARVVAVKEYRPGDYVFRNWQYFLQRVP